MKINWTWTILGSLALILILFGGGMQHMGTNGDGDDDKVLPDNFLSQNRAGQWPPEKHEGYYAVQSSPIYETQGGEPGLLSYIEKLTVTRYNRFPYLEEYEPYGGHIPSEYWLGRQYLNSVPIGTPLWVAAFERDGYEYIMWSSGPFRWIRG